MSPFAFPLTRAVLFTKGWFDDRIKQNLIAWSRRARKCRGIQNGLPSSIKKAWLTPGAVNSLPSLPEKSLWPCAMVEVIPI
jgi:hypothetical protein